jgi:hypothetical protein
VFRGLRSGVLNFALHVLQYKVDFQRLVLFPAFQIVLLANGHFVTELFKNESGKWNSVLGILSEGKVENFFMKMKVEVRDVQALPGRRPLTAEPRVRSSASPCGICGGQSGNGTRFSPNTSVLPCQFHSTGAPLHGKVKKKTNHHHLHHRVAQ